MHVQILRIHKILFHPAQPIPPQVHQDMQEILQQASLYPHQSLSE